MSAKFTLTGVYSEVVEAKLMEVADLIASTLDQPRDSRAWDHLLVYAPRDALERRLQTLNCNGDEYVDSLRPSRANDEVRERPTQDRGFEPRNESSVANGPHEAGSTRGKILSGGDQAIGAAVRSLAPQPPMEGLRAIENRLRNYRIWNHTLKRYESVPLAIEAADLLAALASPSLTAARETRTGAHLLQTAKSMGWLDDGEGALEFMLRRCREVAFEDCGRTTAPATLIEQSGQK